MRKPHTGEVPALEMGAFRQLGGLDAGAKLELKGGQDGEVRITTEMMGDHLLVTAYEATQRLDLTMSVDKCNRLRVRVLCPRCSTQRRKLYLWTGGFACRGCHGLHRPNSVAPRAEGRDLVAGYERLRAKLHARDMPIQCIRRPIGMKRAYFQRWVERLMVVEPLALEEMRRYLQRAGLLGLFSVGPKKMGRPKKCHPAPKVG
jgi:hypothetical protein